MRIHLWHSGFASQRTSNTENVFICWRHHISPKLIPNSNLTKSRFPMIYLTLVDRFENGQYGRPCFHDIRVKDKFRRDILFCNSPRVKCKSQQKVNFLIVSRNQLGLIISFVRTIITSPGLPIVPHKRATQQISTHMRLQSRNTTCGTKIK